MRVPDQHRIRGGLPKSALNPNDVKCVDNISPVQNSPAPKELHAELRALASTDVPEGERSVAALESSGIKLKIVRLVERILENLEGRDLDADETKTLLTGIGILTDKLILLENRSMAAQGGTGSGLTEAERAEKLARVAVLLAKAGSELPPGTSVAVVEAE